MKKLILSTIFAAFLLPMFASAQSFTQSEVAAHNTATDCWIIVSNNVYSVASYIAMHPGGRSAIVNQCGGDATTAFQTRGGTGSHSSSARSTLNTFLIGTLGTSAPVTSTATNGVCGTSHNGNFATMPTTSLCATGSTSSVTGSGPWNWTCQGTNGGASASCVANKVSSTTVTTPAPGIVATTTTPVACSQTSIVKRDAAMSVARKAYDTSVALAIRNKSDSLNAASQLTDTTKRQEAERTARNVYKTSLQNAQKNLKNSKQNAQATYEAEIKLCKSTKRATAQSQRTSTSESNDNKREVRNESSVKQEKEQERSFEKSFISTVKEETSRRVNSFRERLGGKEREDD